MTGFVNRLDLRHPMISARTSPRWENALRGPQGRLAPNPGQAGPERGSPWLSAARKGPSGRLMKVPDRSKSPPKPPVSLGKAGKAFWRRVVDGWTLDVAELEVLDQACATLDRAEQARAVLDKEGLTITAGRGSIKTHPAAAIERDSRTLFARLVRDLGLQHADQLDQALDHRYSADKKRSAIRAVRERKE